MTRTVQLKLHEYRVKKKINETMLSSPDLILPSSLRDSLAKLEKFLDDLRDQLSIEEQKFYILLVTLSEAITNSIIHGNKFQRGKQVFLKFSFNDRQLKFSIEDEGEGFDLNSVKSPIKGENIYRTEGRGILIMKQLADSFQYSKGGRKLELGFRMK